MTPRPPTEFELAAKEAINENFEKLSKQMGNAVSALVDEVNLSSGEAKQNALEALQELERFNELRALQDDANLTPTQAVEFLKGVESHRLAIERVIKKNSKLKDDQGNQLKGFDGKTLTERLREEQKDLTTKEEIVAILQDITDKKEAANRVSTEENRGIKTSFRQGLGALLGPAGPVIETLVSLKEEYGEDVKNITGSLVKWWRGDRHLLTEIENEQNRSNNRDRRLFSLLGEKFRKFTGLIGNGTSGFLRKITDFFSGGGGGGGGGAGRGGMFTRAKRFMRRIPVIGTLFRGGAMAKMSRLLGPAAKIIGRMGMKTLPVIGTLLAAYDLATTEEAKKSDTTMDKAIAYGSGAFSGAMLGLMGGPLGILIGSAVGLVTTGLLRNKTKIKEKLLGAWNNSIDYLKEKFTSIMGFASGFVAFFESIGSSIKDGLTSVFTWLGKHIPGFSDFASFIGRVVEDPVAMASSAAKKTVENVKHVSSNVASAATSAAAIVSEGATGLKDLAVTQTAQTVENVSKLADTTVTAIGAGATKAGEVATETKIAVAQKVESISQKVADKAQKITDNNVNMPLGAAASTVNKSAQGVADFSNAVGGKAILERQMTAVGMTDPKERAMMLAQIDHESGFKSRGENLNYSSVDGLDKTFGRNAAYSKLSAEEKSKLVKNPEALANVVYGNRMGNTEAGDGYNYRGRGMIQLTGKANYEKYGKLLGVDLVKNPELANDPKIAAQVATAFWKENKLSKAAQAGDITAVTQRINGGQNGAADREAKYAKYLKEGSSVVAVNAGHNNAIQQFAPSIPIKETSVKDSPIASINNANVKNTTVDNSKSAVNSTLLNQSFTGAQFIPASFNSKAKPDLINANSQLAKSNAAITNSIAPSSIAPSSIAPSSINYPISTSNKNTINSSVAPSTEVFQRTASVTPEAAVTLNPYRNSTNSPMTNQKNSTENRQIPSTDIPFVLGDNHMVVINAGMMGA